MSESARNKLGSFDDSTMIINNEEALAKRLEDAWALVDKHSKEIIALKAKIEILKEVIVDSRGY